MKKFVVTTTSESGDYYVYFIEHIKKPTNKELTKFLLKHGNDVEGGEIYENVQMVIEVKEFQKLD